MVAAWKRARKLAKQRAWGSREILVLRSGAREPATMDACLRGSLAFTTDGEGWGQSRTTSGRGRRQRRGRRCCQHLCLAGGDPLAVWSMPAPNGGKTKGEHLAGRSARPERLSGEPAGVGWWALRAEGQCCAAATTSAPGILLLLSR